MLDIKDLDQSTSLSPLLLFHQLSYPLFPTPVWPDWAIYCTLGNFSKPVATIILPTFLGNFCKAVKIFIVPVKSFLGNFFRHLVNFYWSHCPLPPLCLWHFISLIKFHWITSAKIGLNLNSVVVLVYAFALGLLHSILQANDPTTMELFNSMKWPSGLAQKSNMYGGLSCIWSINFLGTL